MRESSVPIILETAENDDEKDSNQQDEGGAAVVARRMRLVGNTSLRPDGSFGD